MFYDTYMTPSMKTTRPQNEEIRVADSDGGKRASSDKRRIFLGLNPSTDTLTKIRFFQERFSSGVLWESPEDLHSTVLFGGIQPDRTIALWKKAACHLSLAPVCRIHLVPAWEMKRHLLVLVFSDSSPFWRAVTGIADDLSTGLLGRRSSRPFWPHMTLSRKMTGNSPSRMIATSKADFAEWPAPFFSGIRLYESVLPANRKSRRYTILEDCPFPGMTNVG